MTDPKLREARIAEAFRLEEKTHGPVFDTERRNIARANHLFDLIETDWRPEPEVDAVTLAAREWMVGNGSITTAAYIHDGNADQSTFADAFRAGHAHALANCADVRRMDWLEGQKLSIEATRVKDDLHHYPNAARTLRTKIDRAMESGE